MEVSVLQENLNKVLTLSKPFTSADSRLALCRTVRLTAEDLGDAKREVLCTKAKGLDVKDAGRIAFNDKYIHDLLKVSEGRIQMAGTNPSSPCLWKLTDDQVVMPMFVLWQ